MIDKIYKLTWKSKISYMGHSQGTSQMFSALAENKNNIRDKISAFAALAPVASFSQQTSVKYDDGLKTSLWKTVDEFTKNNIYEFGPTIKLEDFTYLKHVPGM